MEQERLDDCNQVLRTHHRVLARAASDLLDKIPDVRLSRLVRIRGVGAGDHAGRIPNPVGRRRDVVERGVGPTTVGDVDEAVHRAVERGVRGRRLDNLVRRRHAADGRPEGQRGVVAAVRDRGDGRAAKDRVRHRGVEDRDVARDRRINVTSIQDL